MDIRRTATPRPKKAAPPRDYRTLTLPATPPPARRPGWDDASAGDPPRGSGGDGWDDEQNPGEFGTSWDGPDNWDDDKQRSHPSAPQRALRPVSGDMPATRTTAPVTSRHAALIQARPRRKSLTLPLTGGILVRAARNPRPTAPARVGAPPPALKKRLPIWVTGNLVALVIVGMAFTAPALTSTATASACSWYTVKPGDTLKDISSAYQSTASALAQANHVSPSVPIYVGQKLCIPTTWWAQAKSAPFVPPVAQVALPAGIFAGEPCTMDRSLVWTGVISRWTVPPGCFGKIYYPNPRNYMVNGHVIGGFGWCNWWPEALLRNPNVLSWPAHHTPRVGYPVFYAPVNGEHVGHYAFVESIGTGQYTGWLLISEMNMYWRGAGWAKVDYRYIAVDYPGAEYLYP